MTGMSDRDIIEAQFNEFLLNIGAVNGVDLTPTDKYGNRINIIKKASKWYQFTIKLKTKWYFRSYIDKNEKLKAWEFALDLPDRRFYNNHKEASALPDKIELNELADTLTKWYRIVLKEM